MKLLPTTIGAEPKKVGLLIAIVVVGGGVVYWTNSGSDVSPGATASGAPAGAIPSIPSLPSANTPNINPPSPSSGPRLQVRGKGRSIEDFHPSLKVPDGTDLSTIDPTLHLDRLAKVRAVGEQSSPRSLFEFYTPPPPPPPVKPINPVPPPAPTPVKPQTPVTTAPPPPPPIPLKFYGYAGASKIHGRQAFFLDGEDILMASENETIRSRYKVIRIGTTDAEVEDTLNKNKQTLPLIPEIP